MTITLFSKERAKWTIERAKREHGPSSLLKSLESPTKGTAADPDGKSLLPKGMMPAGAVMGEIVSWHMKTRGQRIMQAVIIDSLAFTGFPKEYSPELSVVSAWSKARASMNSSEITIDKIGSNGDDNVVYQFSSRFMVSDSGHCGKSIERDYNCQVYINTKTGGISCPESLEVEAKCKSQYKNAHRYRTGKEVTDIIEEMFKELPGDCLQSINPDKGGAYFVPVEYEDFVDRVETFLNRCGGKMKRFEIHKPGSVDHKTNRSVKEGVEAKIEQTVQELEERVESIADNTRSDKIENVVEEFRTAKALLSSWVNYLQDSSTKAEVKLESIKRTLAEKLASSQK